METFLEKLKARGSQVQETWQKLALNQKILIAGAALMIVVAIIFLIRGTEEKFEVLYTELDPKDAASVVEKLDEYKLGYKLEDNGTTILVSPADKYSTRIKLAGENLPRSETGFELFQENSYGETQTDKKVKYQVALQGELARTIQSLDKVKSARVHLVIPEKTLFSDKEESPSASVAITTKDEEKLNAREIKGVINLVANSVEGLNPDKVVIIDHYGNLISQDLPVEGNNTEILQTQLALKRAFEQEKQQAIQTMLDQTLGKNNAVVRVSGELNFDNKQEKIEKYSHDPLGQFVRSEHIVKKSGTSTSEAPQGVPGTDTNITQYTEVNAAGTVSTTEESDKTRNYELNRNDTVIDYASGGTRYDYLTVTVLINNAASAKAKLGNTEEEKVETVRKIVATACGLRENRGDENVNLEDNISVAFIDFYSKPLTEPAPTGIKKLLTSPLAPLFIALLALIIALLVWLLIRRSSKPDQEDEELTQAFEAIAQEEISLAEIMEQNLSPEEREMQRIKTEIDRIIEEKPESAVQVLRIWLMEEQR